MSRNSAALVALIAIGLVLWLTPPWGIWSSTWVPVAIIAGYVVFLVLADEGGAATNAFATSAQQKTASPVPQDSDDGCASDAA